MEEGSDGALKLERQRKHLLFLLIRNLREQLYVVQQMQNVCAERNKKYSIQLSDIYLERILAFLGYGLMALLSKSTGCVVPLSEPEPIIHDY